MKVIKKIQSFLERKSDSGKPRSTSLTEEIKKMDSSHLLRMTIVFVTWLISVLALISSSEKKAEIFIQKQRAPATIFSDCDFSYIDNDVTESLKKQAELEEPNIYRIDPQVSEMMISKFLIYFSIPTTDTENSPSILPDNDHKFGDLDLNNKTKIGIKELSLIVQSEEKTKIFIREFSEIIENGIINNSEKNLKKGQKIRIMDEKQRLRTRVLRIEEIPNPTEATQELASRISQNYSPENRSSVQNTVTTLGEKLITSNLTYDNLETLKRKDTARKAVTPVIIDVKKGELLMKKGQIIENNILLKYQSYVEEKEKLSGTHEFWQQVFVTAILCAILMILAGIYIYHIHPEVVRSNKQIGIVASVLVINVALNSFTIRLFDILSPALNLNPDILPTVLPLALSSIVLSVLIGVRVALYAGLFVSLLTAIQLNNSFNIVINGMIISMVSGFTVRFAKNHRDYFIKCILAISLTMPTIDFLRLVNTESSTELVIKTITASLVSGIFVAILCMAVLFFIETIFRTYSNMSLLAFCDYNHPLLKMMQIEAPGTYHHSIVVSTLAEQAARDVGANPIQARVCALFHDVGKISKPDYFTENNLDGLNRHDDLSPRMSSIVILNHVKEGIELAIKHKLPNIVRDAIEQHHGKDMISFFYKKAINNEENGESQVIEWDYRYPGPLPKSKESVIVALADTSEAASRSLEKPTPSKVDAIVWELFRRKIQEGELDDADITIRELAIIRKSFTKTITTMMHGRISYPKDEKNENEPDLFSGAMRKDLNHEPEKPV